MNFEVIGELGKLFVVTQDLHGQGHQRERGECLAAHQRAHSMGVERGGGGQQKTFQATTTI